MFICLAALVGFILGFVVSKVATAKAAKGTLIKAGDIWRLEINDPLEKLESKKRIIFNVSNDKEVNEP